jgi:hypothetical protein
MTPLRRSAISSLLRKVFEVSRSATLIQDPSARRTKDSQPSGFGFECCASPVRFRVFQQTVRAKSLRIELRFRSKYLFGLIRKAGEAAKKTKQLINAIGLIRR